MRFTIIREHILKPLQSVIGVVERRQTMPILSNVLIQAKDGALSFTTTDVEIEVIATTQLDINEPGEITVPARKLMDICRALPEGAEIHFRLDTEKERACIHSDKSRFNLTTLSAGDFPNLQEFPNSIELTLNQGDLKSLIDKTQASMAQQDVRYYLNGLMLEIGDGKLKAVATDGHRLAYGEVELDITPTDVNQIIIPRKGVMELVKILQDEEEPVSLAISNNHIRVELPNLLFTSKLIDGQFPDYQRVIPKGSENKLIANRTSLTQALTRTAILSNEKYRGIRLKVDTNVMNTQAHNPEMEEAEEELAVEYQGAVLEMGFNVMYMIEALNVIETDQVYLYFTDSNSSCLITPGNDEVQFQYVVMPMRL